MVLYNDLIFTEAVEQVEAIIASSSADEIATRLEAIAPIPDLAMSCMMILVMKVKGIDPGLSGVELANVQPSFHDLVLPPGVKLDGG